MPEQQNPEHQLEYLKELRRKYEEALSNAQKTGDYTEAEKLKQELDQRLTALEALFPKPEPEKDFIESNNEVIEKGETSLEKAKEIMSEDYFGTEAIKKAFDMTVGIDGRVPYSEAELEQAKNQGEMLVYRVGGLTMEGIVQRVKLSHDEGKLLYRMSSYEEEDFFKNQTPRSGWALVSKGIIENSMGGDYIYQTRVLRDHLLELGSLAEDELKEATDQQLNEIRELMATDWKAAAKQLSELKINQNHRRSAVEALYDFVIRFKNTPDKDRMLEQVHDWTNTLSPKGALVRFGNFDFDGAFVKGMHPEFSRSNVGVISVR